MSKKFSSSVKPSQQVFLSTFCVCGVFQQKQNAGTLTPKFYSEIFFFFLQAISKFLLLASAFSMEGNVACHPIIINFLWLFTFLGVNFWGVLWGCYMGADSWVIGQIINIRLSKWLSNTSSKVMDTDSDNHPDLAFSVSFGQNFPPQPKIFSWKKKVWLDILNWFWVKISGKHN